MIDSINNKKTIAKKANLIKNLRVNYTTTLVLTMDVAVKYHHRVKAFKPEKVTKIQKNSVFTWTSCITSLTSTIPTSKTRLNNHFLYQKPLKTSSSNF